MCKFCIFLKCSDPPSSSTMVVREGWYSTRWCFENFVFQLLKKITKLNISHYC